ncbi:MAG: hypothetical protein ACKOX6_11365, partial [Bdellovibrio sp.]
PGLSESAGIKSFVDNIRRSAISGLTAFAGGGQASAFQLSKDINRVTTVATAADSVKLPVAVSGAEIVVINRGAAAMNVYPAVGEFIDALAVNVPYSIASGSNARFMCGVTGTWDVAAGGSGGGSSAPTLFGSVGSPRSIVAATGITSGASHMSTTALVQEIFVVGSVANAECDISATPQITAGTIVGQEMNIYGTSDTAPVVLDDGTGLKLNGTCKLYAGSMICLKWDGSVWRERSRNGV